MCQSGLGDEINIDGTKTSFDQNSCCDDYDQHWNEYHDAPIEELLEDDCATIMDDETLSDNFALTYDSPMLVLTLLTTVLRGNFLVLNYYACGLQFASAHEDYNETCI